MAAVRASALPPFIGGRMFCAQRHIEPLFCLLASTRGEAIRLAEDALRDYEARFGSEPKCGRRYEIVELVTHPLTE